MTKNLRNLSASVNLKEIGDVVGVYGVIGYEQNIYNGASSLPITDCKISIRTWPNFDPRSCGRQILRIVEGSLLQCGSATGN